VRIAIFCHSIRSDWNHGNAHFLRGIATEVVRRGHEMLLLEARESWSATRLAAEHGEQALTSYREAYPQLKPVCYDPAILDLDEMLDGVELVLVHEWNEPALVQAVGAHRQRTGGYTLLFHDTHHRAVTQPEEMTRYDLSDFDGVLAFGEVLREIYLRRGWGNQVFTWHEAADVHVFHPSTGDSEEDSAGDLVWIGNWGDGERTAELEEFLIQPVRSLGLRALVHGVRYPAHALSRLSDAGIRYGGWLPNHRSPQVFARHHLTVHVPRGPYVRALPGIPTIRVFEALACGIPLVSAPWRDSEGLFRAGTDFLLASSGSDMERHLRELLADGARRRELAESGLQTIRQRHTCGHRVDELFAIHELLRASRTTGALT
jgi:spore maturation protein CgeB